MLQHCLLTIGGLLDVSQLRGRSVGGEADGIKRLDPQVLQHSDARLNAHLVVYDMIATFNDMIETV